MIDETKVSDLLEEVIARRCRGERLSDAQIIADHPELMPDLREELCALDAIHRAVILGSGTPVDSPIESPADAFCEPVLHIPGYLIEREINSGGQATVFKAIQERTGRAVAVKIIHGGPFVGTHGRKRFDRESEILARLNHPNIVSILDRGRTADGSFYLVMDFVEGATLDAYLRDLGKDAVFIVQLFIKIARAIEEAHKQNVIHRDLKPMNILIDLRGAPHILDFGMARLLDDSEDTPGDESARTVLTRTGQVLGSLPWSSPEQITAMSDAVDGRSDVYALGVMLFFALAGEFPYPVSGNIGAVVSHISNTPPAPLVRLASNNGINIPASLESIIHKSLSKSVAERYPSAGPFADDLEACLAGKSPVRPKRRFGVFLIGAILALITASTVVPIAILLRPADLRPFDPGRPDSARPLSQPSDPSAMFVNSVDLCLLKIPHGVVHPLESASALSVDYDFYLSACDITQHDYLLVIGRNPSGSRNSEFDAPVECVTQPEAQEYCRLLGSRDHRTYRLPTSTEWKYAYYSGRLHPLTIDAIDHTAWYAGNSGGRPHPTRDKLPNGWGLFDMLGNVRQWCSDPGHKPSTAMVEGVDYLTPAGDCFDPAKREIKCRATTRLPTVGFRVLCESSDQK